jgi:hypothetical protein
MIKWAVLELMGHNRHIGRVSEVQLFGSPMGQMEELDEEEIPELDPFCTGETDCDCFNGKPAHVRFVPMGLPPGPSGEEAF